MEECAEGAYRSGVEGPLVSPLAGEQDVSSVLGSTVFLEMWNYTFKKKKREIYTCVMVENSMVFILFF